MSKKKEEPFFPKPITGGKKKKSYASINERDFKVEDGAPVRQFKTGDNRSFGFDIKRTPTVDMRPNSAPAPTKTKTNKNIEVNPEGSNPNMESDFTADKVFRGKKRDTEKDLDVKEATRIIEKPIEDVVDELGE